VVNFAKNLSPSPRGELEITDINKCYLEQAQLNVKKLGRGSAWLDTGTHDSLLSAASFIETVEQRQGLKVACPEEVAYRMKYITSEEVLKLAEPLKKNTYGQYLLNMIKEEKSLVFS